MIVIILLAGVSALAVIHADKFDAEPSKPAPIVERRK